LAEVSGSNPVVIVIVVTAVVAFVGWLVSSAFRHRKTG